MSGSKQHYIPRSLLRGFLSAPVGKAERVWVLRRDKFFNPSLDGAAAQRFFYSKLPTDTTKTLDERITDYESGFADLIHSLRDAPFGRRADPAIAAEVVTHLCIRTAHFRSAMARGVEAMSLHAHSLLADETVLRNLMGVDDDDPNRSRLQTMISETLDNDARLATSPLPKSVLHRILVAAARENFSQLIGAGKPQLGGMLAYLFTQANAIASNAHQKALEKSLAPPVRIEGLSTLDWDLVKSEESLILPDCVALGIEHGGDVYPYMFADADKIGLVLVPISAGRLLIGQRQPFPNFGVEHFNLLAASRSHEFFIANDSAVSITRLAPLIGTESHSVVHRAISEAMVELQTSALPLPKYVSDENLLLVPDRIEPFGPASFDLHFQNCADAETAARIADVISSIVDVISRVLPLSRLEGITFAKDYIGALRDFAQQSGRAAESLAPIDKKFGESVSMAPTVVRDGVAKTHIIMQCWVGHALVSEHEQVRQAGTDVLIGQLAYAGCHELVELRFPNSYGIKDADQTDAWRYGCTGSAWSHYFSARASAPFCATEGCSYRELLITAIEQLQITIPTARLEYRFHGNLDKFMDIVADHLRPVLQFSSQLIGHYDGHGAADYFDKEGKLDEALKRLQLRAWFDIYAIDLRKFWDRRTEWKSPTELMALNSHTDRLLWPFGIFIWSERGSMRVLIPLATDAPQLSKAIFKWPFRTLRVVGRSMLAAIALRLGRKPI